MVRISLALCLLVSSRVLAEPADPSLVQFLEARVADELAVDGIVLAQRDLGVVIEQVADKLLVSLVARATGTVVAAMTVGYPPADREATLAIVTQVTATMYGHYTAPVAPPDAAVATSVPVVAPRSHVRSGLTFDLGFGLAKPGGGTGWAPELALGVSIGAWIYPAKVALLGRIALATVDQARVTTSASYIATEFIGATIQYWLDPHLWVAGGPGFVAFSAAYTYDSIFPTHSACSPDCLGAGLDLRAGYSFGIGASQLDVSLEAIAGYYANNPSYALHSNPDATNPAQPGVTTTLMALLAYRFL